jgi:hypothetical protein
LWLPVRLRDTESFVVDVEETIHNLLMLCNITQPEFENVIKTQLADAVFSGKNGSSNANIRAVLAGNKRLKEYTTNLTLLRNDSVKQQLCKLADEYCAKLRECSDVWEMWQQEWAREERG